MGNYLSRVSESITSVISSNNNNDTLKKRARKRKYESESDTKDNDIDIQEDDDETDDDDNTTNEDIDDNLITQNQSIEDELSQNLSNLNSNTTQLNSPTSSLDRFRRRLNASSSLANSSTTLLNSPLIRTNNSSEGLILDETRSQSSNTNGLLFNTSSNTIRQSDIIRNRKHQSKLKKKNSKIEKKLKTPTKKKMKSTSTYIYNTLYLKGENSDVTVRALDKDWQLHKIYLCQSPYFSSMLQGGKWKESSQSYIDISIPDSNVTQNALFIAFGCLYKDDIEIIPNEVVNVLAAASLFSLEGLLNECEQIMMENVNVKTVFLYYDASITYGLQKVTEKTLKWLTMNIMITSELKIQDINLNLLMKIIGSKDLMIIQVETDLYTLCKRWLYYNLSKKYENIIEKSKTDGSLVTCNTSTKGWQKNATELFAFIMKIYGEGYVYLLEIPELDEYVTLFKLIRLQHILTDFSSLKIICNDRIIPKSWIQPHYASNWLNSLYIDQQLESSEFNINETDFLNECVRFGRILNDDTLYTWRWVGFHYGIDLLVTYMHRSFTLKRNTMYIYSPYKGFLSNKTTQRIYFKMFVAQLDKYGNIKWSKQTEFTCLDLHRNEEKFVFNLDNNISFPLIMNLHVAFHPSLNTNLFIDSN